MSSTAMRKLKLGTVTTETVKSNFKEAIESLLQGKMYLHLRVQSTEHQHIGSSFYMMY